MVNRSSHAKHIPTRSCVICRKKKEQKQLLRFGIIESDIVFDLNKKLTGRGYYVCDENECIEKLKRWLKKKNERRKGNLSFAFSKKSRKIKNGF